MPYLSGSHAMYRNREICTKHIESLHLSAIPNYNLLRDRMRPVVTDTRGIITLSCCADYRHICIRKSKVSDNSMKYMNSMVCVLDTICKFLLIYDDAP